MVLKYFQSSQLLLNLFQNGGVPLQKSLFAATSHCDAAFRIKNASFLMRKSECRRGVSGVHSPFCALAGGIAGTRSSTFLCYAFLPVLTAQVRTKA
jgi:hypothetical protein